jgi:outer membrane protein OmpA-like peptidoglycan-associated protein
MAFAGRLAGILLSLGLWPATAGTAVYSNFLDNGAWQAKSSVFSCSLVHSVPFYGDAVFETRAGESSRFYLQGDVHRFAAGQATLIARSPVWAEVARSVELGAVAVAQKRRALQLPARDTERMLAELFDGMELVFSRDPWYGAEDPSQLAITTVGFRPVYQIYLDCLAGLLPANFDQIKRTSVYFGSSKFEDFHPSELRKLDNIVAYLKADSSVRELFIDGHTDGVGTREDNLVLAEKRAEEVTRYLVNKGLPKDAITSRWHGERYPVATNETLTGRAKNRRVTIRLEKLEIKE